MKDISRVISDIEFIKNTMKKNDDPAQIISSLFLWIGGFNLIRLILQFIVFMNAHRLSLLVTLSAIISSVGSIILSIIIFRKLSIEKNKFESFQKLAISLIILVSFVLPLLFSMTHALSSLFQNDAQIMGAPLLMLSTVNEFAGVLLFCLFLIVPTSKRKISSIAKNFIAVSILFIYFLLIALKPSMADYFIEFTSLNVGIAFQQLFYVFIISVGYLCLGVIYKKRMERIANGN